MKLFAVLWVVILALLPPAIFVMAAVGIWGDTRWLYTAMLAAPAWGVMTGVTIGVLNRERGTREFEIPDWMHEN